MDAGEQETTTLTVRLDRELLTRFQVVCVRRHESMSEVIREFVGWYVEKEEAEHERVRGLPPEDDRPVSEEA
jgi:metal-responsive CopG/Arc/MetJ family transcriptional regulator